MAKRSCITFLKWPIPDRGRNSVGVCCFAWLFLQLKKKWALTVGMNGLRFDWFPFPSQDIIIHKIITGFESGLKGKDKDRPTRSVCKSFVKTTLGENVRFILG